MKGLVIDASVGIALVRPERWSQVAKAVVRDGRASGVMVPTIFWLEIVNSLARRHAYSGADILEAIRELDEVGLATVESDRSGVVMVIDLVERHGLTAYDASYLALASDSDAALATADRRLALAAGDRALLIGPDAGIAEERAAYRTREASWPSWSGAGDYLAQLRSGSA